VTDFYPHPSSAAAAATGRGNRRKNTGPELRLSSALHRRGYRYRRDFPLTTGEIRVRPDFVFTRLHLAVFLDGCYWHGCPVHGATPKANANYWVPKLLRNRERDARVTDALRGHGWTVLRIWEHEPLATAVARVERAVRGEDDV
jgi:DNA mismatch endonuclease, patch repair protein